MTVCAIICEYNPMHMGHLYHLEQTRAALGTDARFIAVMSGHVVQRGEFPILTKYARARLALLAGHDLVFELPAPHACAPAERFARGAVSVISKLGCVTHLSFGAECRSLEELRCASEKITATYPKDISLARAMPLLFPEHAKIFTPNNILGAEYLRALRDIAPHIKPIMIPRACGSEHDRDGSAMYWRKKLFAREDCSGLPFYHVLSQALEEGLAPISLKNAEKAVLSHLRGLSQEGWGAMPDVKGGLAQRISLAAKESVTLGELYANAKTKRYTMARIRRVVLSGFLGITERQALAPPHIRLLGIGKYASELLSAIQCPIISRPAAHKRALGLESAITDQLTLFMPTPQPSGLEWRSGVVRGKDETPAL